MLIKISEKFLDDFNIKIVGLHLTNLTLCRLFLIMKLNVAWVDILEESEGETVEHDTEVSEEEVKKPRFKLQLPSPFVYVFVGPFLFVFIIYIVLTKILLTSDLGHEAKLEQALKSNSDLGLEEGFESGTVSDHEASESEEEGGFLDVHNYFQFPMAFAVNIPDTNKNLTFELAVSSFQSGVTAEWFFENFTAFVPALRSDILYFMGGHSLEELNSSEFQASILIDLKDVINKKLESLGSKPDVSKVLFVTFVIT